MSFEGGSEGARRIRVANTILALHAAPADRRNSTDLVSLSAFPRLIENLFLPKPLRSQNNEIKMMSSHKLE